MRTAIIVPIEKLLNYTQMDDEQILQMVADGELDASQIEDFKNLDSGIQELVESGDLSVDDALEIDL